MSGAEVFKLYANCLPVRGARRSLICDLQTQRAQFIPNDLFDILTEMDGRPLAEIKRQFESSESAVIDAYFAMLVEQDFGFWCDEPERFPPLSLDWDRPETITNAIIDIDEDSRHDYRAIFAQLDALGCRAVQVRAFEALSLAQIVEILEACGPTRLRHLDLVLKFQPELTREALADLGLRYQVISRLLVHSSPFAMKATFEPLPILLRFDPHEVRALSCGEVAPDYFSLTVDHFTEALHFNTCLNRKLSIAADGEIKSCPAMRHSLGNARCTPLATAARQPLLVQLGGITKDQIEVCRDCEFRYICTDCRAFTRDDDLYAKPAKCAYDPYTATWAATSATA